MPGPQRPPVVHDDDTLYARIRAEFCEMPGMNLTLRQASRLFDLETARCERVLEALVALGTLCRRGESFACAGTGRQFA